MGMNNRRKLIIALGAGGLAWAGAVRAQAPGLVLEIDDLLGEPED